MSCLFDSLSKNLDTHTSSTLREIICDYLDTNPFLIDNITAEKIIYYESKLTLEEYIRKMRCSSTWGGGIEIKSFCNIFKINVNVINIRDSFKIIEFLSNESCIKYLIEISWSGNHYEYMSSKKIN